MTLTRAIEAGSAMRAASDIQTAAAWDQVFRTLAEIGRFQPASGDHFKKTPLGVLATARTYAKHLSQRQPTVAPDAVYPLPDGNVMFEWRLAGGRVCRVEIEPENKIQYMTTFAGGRPTVFADYVLRLDQDPFEHACQIYTTQGVSRVFRTDYQLAS